MKRHDGTRGPANPAIPANPVEAKGDSGAHPAANPANPGASPSDGGQLRGAPALRIAPIPANLPPEEGEAPSRDDERPEITHPLTRGFIQTEMLRWGDAGGPLDWARQFIDLRCTSRQGEAGRAFLSNPLSLEALLLHFAVRAELAEGGAISDRLGREIAQWVTTDRDAFQMARELVADSACKGPPLPAALHPFAAKVASGAQRPKKRGDTGWKLLNRNRTGMAALLVLTSPEGFGLKPTRNAAGGSLCACDVLGAAASGLGWASIDWNRAVEIWRNRARLSLEWEVCLLIGALMNRPAGQLPTDVALRALHALGATPSGRKVRKEPDASSG